MNGDFAQCCYQNKMWSTSKPCMLLAYQVKLKRHGFKQDGTNIKKSMFSVGKMLMWCLQVVDRLLTKIPTVKLQYLSQELYFVTGGSQ